MKADGIGAAGAVPPTIRPKPVDHAPAPAGAPVDPAHTDVLPASPPRELLDEIAAAQRVVEELAHEGRQLRFHAEPAGRIVVEVQDLEGNVLRRIPPSGALDVAGGEPLPE